MDTRKDWEVMSNEARILYVQYTNPAAYPPLQHSSRILADRGWEVFFLGKETDDTEDLRFPLHERITVRRLSYVSTGWRQKLHYVLFMFWAFAWALRWRPDWLYVSDPLACPSACLLSILPGVSVVYHEHDSPPPAEQAEKESAFMRLVRRGRRVVARRADVCVLPNEQRVRHFVQETGASASKTHCVWNCPDREEAIPSVSPSEQYELRVLYQGSLNTARLPFTVLNALSQLPDFVRLEVVGYETVGSRGYLAKLKDRASHLDVFDRVDIRGAISRPKLIDHARKCHVGLSFMPMHTDSINMKYMAGASNKPFEYMAAGLPLLVSDLPDWREMYVEPGYGLACDPRDADSVAESLRFYAEQPDERRRMGEQGRQRILREWNYEEQFAPVQHTIEG